MAPWDEAIQRLERRIDNGLDGLRTRAELLAFLRRELAAPNLAARVALLYQGTGTPEAVVTAPPGAIYQRLDGGAGTSLYVKESGTGNTGWVGK